MTRNRPTGPTAVHHPDAGIGIDVGPDREDTKRDSIYLDGTLVLVGCGKSKRDPEDPGDLHAASVGPDEPMTGLPGADTGPAWRAEDLYTSPYFAVKREFAEIVTNWARSYDAGPWAVLSAEHGVVPHWKDLKPYDTTVDHLGDDPTNPEHRVPNTFGRRRPDGREIVTEMDQWAATVAAGLSKWVAGFREQHAEPWENDAGELLVLAGQDYITPLRERGVFEYGISRMAGNPNEGYTMPLETRYLFEEIPAGGNGEQMGWMSDVIDRLEPLTGASDAGEQVEFGRWTGSERACDRCETSAEMTPLTAVGGGVYCDDCHPRECSRCGAWTHENGLGNYPLCSDCQTERGGRKPDPVGPADGDQTTLGPAAATDGGDPP